jgi:hypothetical protein
VTLFLLLLLFPLTSEAQTFCQNLGTFVICDGGSTTIVSLGPTGGVITQEDGRGALQYDALFDIARAGSGPPPIGRPGPAGFPAHGAPPLSLGARLICSPAMGCCCCRNKEPVFFWSRGPRLFLAACEAEITEGVALPEPGKSMA